MDRKHCDAWVGYEVDTYTMVGLTHHSLHPRRLSNVLYWIASPT